MYDNPSLEAAAAASVRTLPAPVAVTAPVDRLDFSAVKHNLVDLPRT